MFYCKNIGIWFLLLSLVRAPKLCSSLEDNKAIPYHSVHIQDETQNRSNISQNTGYPSVREYIPVKHAEENIQEIEKHGDESDSSIFSKGGFGGIFSWWRSGSRTKATKKPKGKHKRPTKGPLRNETLFSPRIEITYPFFIETTEQIFFPAIDVTCLPDTETIFPPVNETVRPPDFETCLPETETIFPPVSEASCLPDIEMTYPPTIDMTCLPNAETLFSPLIETIFSPVNEATFPPDTETFFPTVSEPTYVPDNETKHSPIIDIACLPDTELTYPLVTETTSHPYNETIYPPLFELTCPSNNETIYPPIIENTYTSIVETICPPHKITAWPSMGGNNEDVTYKATMEMDTIVLDVSTTTTSELLEINTFGSTTNGSGSINDNTIGLFTNDNATLEPATTGIIGPTTDEGYGTTVGASAGPTSGSDTIDFDTNVPSDIISITNSPFEIDSNTSDHETLISGPVTIDSNNDDSTTVDIVISDDGGKIGIPTVIINPPSTKRAEETVSPEDTNWGGGDSSTDDLDDTFTMDDFTIRITVDPAAISTDPDPTDSDIDILSSDSSQSTSSSPISSSSSSSSSTKARYITACYTITTECPPITIGTPVICEEEIEPFTDSSFDGGKTNRRSTTAIGTASDSNDDIGDPDLSLSSDVNTGTSRTGKTGSTLTGASAVPSTTGVSIPALKMFGAGMILPVYQFPFSPFLLIPTAPPNPPKKVPLNSLSYDKYSVLSKVQSGNNSKYGLDESLQLKNNIDMRNCNNLNRTLIVGGFVPIPIKDKFMVASDTKKVVDQKYGMDNKIKNRNYSQINLQNNGQIGSIKDPSLTDENFQNQKKGVFGISQKKNFRDPLEKYIGNRQKIFYERSIPVKSERNELRVFNYFKPQQSLPTQLSNTLARGSTENYITMKNISTVEDILSNRDRHVEFVKYNDTYLSENSNTSINLVDLCKNVTCQGSNYLSQCCSRAFGLGKCEGEDFSYLHPIPGDTTTVTTTVNELERSAISNGSYPNVKNSSSTSCDASSSKKRKSRVVRENELNDFIKFQLMHGMTNPDGKAMMNALKEANLEFQKVNREFHSNDAANILEINGNIHGRNSPVIDNQRLAKLDASPLTSNKILDDLKATITNRLLQPNYKLIPYQKNKYRYIRNQGLQDQIECFRENNLILERLKKETEIELKRLCLLETKRHEEEMLFDKERERELNELKTIQELIHREFESRPQGDSAKRNISYKLKKILKEDEPTKNESTYSKLVKNIENSVRNDDLDSFILNRYSPLGGNSSSSISVEKFPELEIKNSPRNSHDDGLLVLNIGSGKESPSERFRKRRHGYNHSQNKQLKDDIKSVDSSENISGML